MWLLVGLGNPGPTYEGTRHNVGFQVIDVLAERGRASAPRAKLGAEVSEIRIGAERVLLCKPMEFMNTSGLAVVRVAQFWKVEPARTVVVHDELDLPFGRLKLGLIRSRALDGLADPTGLVVHVRDPFGDGNSAVGLRHCCRHS